MPWAPTRPKIGRVNRKSTFTLACHSLSLLCEALGAWLIFLEARRIDATLEIAGNASYAGGPAPGYEGWIYHSGVLGFWFLLFGIVVTGISVLFEYLGKA